MKIKDIFPKGKYNGQPIDGFKFLFHIHLSRWYWIPMKSWNFGEPYLIWFCFYKLFLNNVYCAGRLRIGSNISSWWIKSQVESEFGNITNLEVKA